MAGDAFRTLCARRSCWASVLALTAGAVLAAGPAAAQGPGDPHVSDPPLIYMIQWRGETATDRGFIDYFAQAGIPVEIVLRNAARDPEALLDFKAEIDALQPDLVYTWSMAAAQGVSGLIEEVDPARHVTDRPVVNCMVADPVMAGISLAWESSGRNITGASHVAPVETQMKALKIFDDFDHLAVLYDPTEESPVQTAEDLEALSEDMGYRLSRWPVPLGPGGKPDPESLEGLLGEIAAAEPDFLYLGPDSFMAVNLEFVTEEATRLGIPVFGASEVFMRDGAALLGLVSNYYNVGQYCGYKAEQILLHGVDPADLPFDTLQRFSYLVNLDTARKLDYYPPLSLISFVEMIGGEEAAAR